MITFTTDNREYYSYQYDEDNHINSINCDSDFDAKSVGLKYDNDLVTDVVSESTDSDKYWYKKYRLDPSLFINTQCQIKHNTTISCFISCISMRRKMIHPSSNLIFIVLCSIK